MTWNLYLDDKRTPAPLYLGRDWILARTSEEAKVMVLERGMPENMALDHDLGLLPSGEKDRAIDFLKWLAHEYWDGVQPVPAYTIHSSNPAGAPNLDSFMDSWARSINL